MKTALILAAIIASISAAAYAQMVCTQYPNGQTICTPVGGGPSVYR